MQLDDDQRNQLGGDGNAKVLGRSRLASAIGGALEATDIDDDDEDSVGWSTSMTSAMDVLDTSPTPQPQPQLQQPHADGDQHNTDAGAHTQHNDTGSTTRDPLAIYVSNINWETTAQTLREVFSQRFGAVSHVHLKENKVRRGPSYAFLVFESAESANQAIGIASMSVDGRLLKFEPRRLQQATGGNGKAELLPPGDEEDDVSAALSAAVANGASRVRSLQGSSSSSDAATMGDTSGGSSSGAAKAAASGCSGVGGAVCRLFVGLGGGATGEEQKGQLERLFSQCAPPPLFPTCFLSSIPLAFFSSVPPSSLASMSP
eukprot:COSAG05_NODE_1212_length_5494_cov_603.311399_6_plen_317_part_00